MSEIEQTDGAVAFAEMRQRFKSTCKATENRFQNYQIRVHRALSWWERAAELDADENPEGRLLFAWIAFNALYGSWDDAGGMPAKDRACWGAFLSKVVSWDRDAVVETLVRELRDPVLKLFDNKFLDQQFWRSSSTYVGSRRAYYLGQSLYAERSWCRLLELIFERIYVLRSQIVHGAATRNSRLNRETLRDALRLFEAFLLPLLQIVVDYGAHDEWPILCYPPIDTTAKPAPKQTKPAPR